MICIQVLVYLKHYLNIKKMNSLFILDTIRVDTNISMSLMESEGLFNHLISIRTGTDAPQVVI